MDVKKEKHGGAVSKGKVISIFLLYVLSVLIILAGAALIVASCLGNTYFNVLSSRIPGAVFGLVILFLGVRYFFSVRRLKAEVYKPDAAFSWNNFRTASKTK